MNSGNRTTHVMATMRKKECVQSPIFLECVVKREQSPIFLECVVKWLRYIVVNVIYSAMNKIHATSKSFYPRCSVNVWIKRETAHVLYPAFLVYCHWELYWIAKNFVLIWKNWQHSVEIECILWIFRKHWWSMSFWTNFGTWPPKNLSDF